MFVTVITHPDNHCNLHTLSNSLNKWSYKFVPLDYPEIDENSWIILTYNFQNNDIAEKFLELAKSYIECGQIGKEKPHHITVIKKGDRPSLNGVNILLPSTSINSSKQSYNF